MKGLKRCKATLLKEVTHLTSSAAPSRAVAVPPLTAVRPAGPRTCLSVLCRLGLRHSFATPVGVHLGSPVIAPGGVPQGARGACRDAEQKSGAAWLVPAPAAGRCGLRRRGPHGGPWACWPDGRERWHGDGPGGCRTAGVRRGLCCAPDVARSAEL
ncbi:hypothetical protein NDU88_001694 [Pleurodeles waltl]|uniref:Uncharacterized protein n=1 Tax=Pleurodeles waltl TaxID=8319 RepID=A0AAV7VB50_PLEWA|nr:hypothetical protein NDU88_001694 [Pleurodeles waltl]